MDVNTLKSVYFIGAGGIGMSALVRYFLSKGKNVGGYDRTATELTQKLNEEGAQIQFSSGADIQSYEGSGHQEFALSRTDRDHIEAIHQRKAAGLSGDPGESRRKGFL